MHRFPRSLTAMGAATALAAGALVGGPASTAGAATCLPTPTLLRSAPLHTFALPGGANVRIWDTGNLTDDMKELRIVAVRIPKGSLTPTVASSATLATGQKPSVMSGSDPKAVVVLNGWTFDPAKGGIPTKSEIRGGVVRKLSRATGNWSLDNNLAIYSAAKQVWVSMLDMTGSVVTGRGTFSLTAVNWHSLQNGITAYTSVWGTKAHPYGPRTVVVSGGRVSRILTGSAGAARPAAGEIWLTAPSGSGAATFLSGLSVDTSASASWAPGGFHWFDKVTPNSPVGQPTGVIGVGTTLVRYGVNNTACKASWEVLRPRSAIGWLPNGDMLAVTVSGRALLNGVRWGGGTMHHMAAYMAALGADVAVGLDGGTSTTLLVRRSVGGPWVRLDRSITDYERPVVDALVFRAA